MFKEEHENMCPVITKYITVKEKCPWFNGDIIRARKRRRAAEKKWKRRKTRENRASYNSESNNINYLMKRAKIDYYKRKIHEAGTDMGKLSIYIPWPFLPVCGGSRQHKRNNKNNGDSTPFFQQ